MGGRDPFFLDRGHGECSPKPEEGKDGEDDDDQSNKINNLVHVPLLVFGRSAGARVIGGASSRILCMRSLKGTIRERLSRAQFGSADPVPICDKVSRKAINDRPRRDLDH